MSREVKVGILTIVTIALAFWGYKFILGKNLLRKSNYYVAYFDRIDGLKVGTPVRINGVRVGSVGSVDLDLSKMEDGVKISMDLDKDINLPPDAVAVMVTTTFLGDQVIAIEYAKPCDKKKVKCLESGSTLEGEVRGVISYMAGVDQISNYVENIDSSISGLPQELVKVLYESEDSPVRNTLKDLEASMANLKDITYSTSNLLRNSSGNIASSLDNLEALSATLKDKKDNFGNLIENADEISNQIAESDLKSTIQTIDETIAELKSTMSTTNEALGSINSLVGEIQSGEGTLGKFVKDDKLYYELKNLAHSADSLISDFHQKPYRYMPLKGRKKVKRYDKLDEKE